MIQAKKRTTKIRAGLWPIRGSKILRSPDIDKETRLLSPFQVFPTCW